MKDDYNWFLLSRQAENTLRTHIQGAKRLTEDECMNLLAILDKYTAEDACDHNYRKAADTLPIVREGECEIDDHAVVSQSEEGAYVMAWVWVPRSDAHPEYADCLEGSHSWVNDPTIRDGACDHCAEPYGDPD